MTLINRRKFIIDSATTAASAGLPACMIPPSPALSAAARPGGDNGQTSQSGAWFEHSDLPWVGKLSQPQYEIQFEYNVKKIPMRDCVLLSANIWRPKAEGKFPVIYMHLPYDKSSAGF